MQDTHGLHMALVCLACLCYNRLCSNPACIAELCKTGRKTNQTRNKQRTIGNLTILSNQILTFTGEGPVVVVPGMASSGFEGGDIHKENVQCAQQKTCAKHIEQHACNVCMLCRGVRGAAERGSILKFLAAERKWQLKRPKKLAEQCEAPGVSLSCEAASTQQSWGLRGARGG